MNSKEGKQRILVIDDEAMYRINLCDYLEDEGFCACPAGSGEEALKLMEFESFVAAIVDLRLPGIDGYSFILEAHKLQPQMIFLIHSGIVNSTIPPAVQQLGITQSHFLLKPLVEHTLLSQTLHQLLSGSHLQ